jgi:hypothetical protein
MGGGVWAYAVAVAAGIPAYVCEGGEVPLTPALVTMGVGIGPDFTFMGFRVVEWAALCSVRRSPARTDSE